MDQQTVRGQSRAIVAGIAGNVMEWYDFSVYGYFAAIIGRNFFPTGDRTTSLIAAFGVFAAGFFMRPLGSILFGYIGDKKGRKLALTISVGMMAVPTFLIGVLPSYQQIGLWASLSLVLLRLLQGLSVGGEFTTSAIFLVEGSAARRRGFLGSFAPLGASAGTLLGSAVGAAVTTLLGQSSIESWGWRVPFLIGILVGVVGLYIRSGLVEDRLAQPKTKSPIREAFQTEWRTILRLIGLNAAFAVSFYMGFVYVTTYIRQVDHIAQSTALDINTVAMLVSLVLIPLIGALSDRIGRKHILLAATGGLFVSAWPLFSHHPEIAGAPGSDRVRGAGGVLWRHRSDGHGGAGAGPSSLHRALSGLQRRNGLSRRDDADGRRLYDPAQPIRPLPGLPADGRGGGFLRYDSWAAGDL
jgi:MFS transporter, MHS family, proline/betaine transporter